ncbi:SOS response-associated peptidase [Corynebacterium sp. H78]|uniref:SOS response-associated peptidase n=1 Tax=Corynebacterium sp. H78 TaxID=3133417 RepID=UPI0030A0994F
MCGRFTLFTVGEQLLREFSEIDTLSPVVPDGQLPTERWNIGPTMPIVALARNDAPSDPLHPGTIAATVRWGLVPHWATSMPKTPYFNARAETWKEKPTFRAGQPCVIPMNGWYEWRDKAPFMVTHRNSELIYVAGLWARCGDLVSATILTTEAVGHLSSLHHRMPRVLASDGIADWLDQSNWAHGGAVGMANEALVDCLDVQPVNKALGNVANDGAWLMQP